MNHDFSHCNGHAVREITPLVGRPFSAKTDCPFRIRCHRYLAAQDPNRPEVMSWVDTPEFTDGTCPLFWEEQR